MKAGSWRASQGTFFDLDLHFMSLGVIEAPYFAPESHLGTLCVIEALYFTLESHLGTLCVIQAHYFAPGITFQHQTSFKNRFRHSSDRASTFNIFSIDSLLSF